MKFAVITDIHLGEENEFKGAIQKMSRYSLSYLKDFVQKMNKDFKPDFVINLIKYMDRFKLIPAVYLMLIKDNQILLLKRANTGYEDGNYSLPAGHLDGNETATQAMIREAKEEIGIQVIAEDLEFAHIMHRKSAEERADFFFRAKKWQGEPINCEPNKCSELKWYPINQLPKNVIPCVLSAIDSYQNKIFYSEFGWK